MRTMRQSLAARLGGWSTRHRKTAVFGWLLFVVLAATLGGMSGMVSATNSEMDTGESAKATRLLEDAGIEEPAGELVMVSSDRVDGWRAAATDVRRALADSGGATAIKRPVPSEDRRSALITFDVAGDPDKAADQVEPLMKAAREAGEKHQGTEVYQYGQASADHWLNKMLGEDFAKAEWTAVPLALGILLVAFGALVAALLPVALAVTAFVAANGVLMMVSHQLHLDETTFSVMLLIGLAVGVDYCLFYLRRERDERAAGRDPETALRIAADTSGRAVLISGLTVMVAMSGMFLSGLLLFKGFAVATILVVFVAMLGSVTVLPAVLSLLGDRVNRGRLPFLGGRRGEHRSSGRISGAVLRPVLAKPGLFAVLAALLMLGLAAPALGMKTEQLGLDKQMPSDSPLRVSAERINETFPGGPAPARIVLRTPDDGEQRARDAVAAFERRIEDDPRFGQDVRAQWHSSHHLAVLDVPLAGDGTDQRSQEALTALRSDLVPRYLEPASQDEQVHVTGELASSQDFTDRLNQGILPVLAFITSVTFVLMLVCFRSLPIAVVTMVLNLMSVGAAYGVMTAVFQHGWGADLLATEKVGAIESWMPLFVLVILFGLSMDYHVFVVSRIREAHDRGVSTREAIDEGIRGTAGAVTGAAVIMVAVFSVFATLSMQDMKQMGVGLAVAVLLDATVVRMLLLPALMRLLGDRNWYLPRWLGWLPRLEHGPAPGPAPEPAPRAEPVGVGRR
ncbi:MMPL family transporter [Streptomyces sp. NPDC005438]|uniref:MMPL family transporter n=1 Tax=Streptomyces sp. NPDC005438 TaxID=3156880 RepID=UPI0033B49046